MKIVPEVAGGSQKETVKLPGFEKAELLVSLQIEGSNSIFCSQSNTLI